MTLALWYGESDYSLPWETAAAFDYDEFVDLLVRDYSAFTGIHARKLNGRLQFYSYVLRKGQDLPKDAPVRRLSERDVQTMHGASGEGQ